MEFLKHPEFSEEQALAQRVGRIFGYDGLDIQVHNGEGWKVLIDENGITLVVDPSQLLPPKIKDATGSLLPVDTKAPSQYSVYGTAHELGHVEDYLQPDVDFEKLKSLPPTESFFWNIIDDGVINRRLRNIPLLNVLTDEIYKDILFPPDNFSDMPKHIQFMYGWLLRNVTPNRKITTDPEVEQALDNLDSTRIGFLRYDLYRTLAHPDTDLKQRRAIATKHILPIYNSFLEQDRQDNQSPSQSQGQSQVATGNNSTSNNHNSGQGDPSDKGAPGSGTGIADPSDWKETYDAYNEATGNVEPTISQPANPAKQSSSTNPQEAIKEAADALNKFKQGNTNKQSSNPGGQIDAFTNAAGTIAAELMLSPENAAKYQAIVEQYRPEIHEVAKLFQQLTVPSVEYTSPRYKKISDAYGLKLSPKDLFQVVIAQHAQIDPAIWKPVETISKREGFSFSGLDVSVLIDVSGSMSGAKANSAAACSIMLMEGLESARRMVERYNPRSPKPDVRLQVILFGSAAKIVAPLAHETKPKDKGVAFATTLAAQSSSTLVADSISITTKNASTNPERTQLVFIITDGNFGDEINAKDVIRKGTRSNYFLYQYILSSPSTQAITTQFSHINNPSELPRSLNKQLKIVASKFIF